MMGRAFTFALVCIFALQGCGEQKKPRATTDLTARRQNAAATAEQLARNGAGHVRMTKHATFLQEDATANPDIIFVYLDEKKPLPFIQAGKHALGIKPQGKRSDEAAMKEANQVIARIRQHARQLVDQKLAYVLISQAVIDSFSPAVQKLAQEHIKMALENFAKPRECCKTTHGGAKCLTSPGATCDYSAGWLVRASAECMGVDTWCEREIPEATGNYSEITSTGGDYFEISSTGEETKPYCSWADHCAWTEVEQAECAGALCRAAGFEAGAFLAASNNPCTASFTSDTVWSWLLDEERYQLGTAQYQAALRARCSYVEAPVHQRARRGSDGGAPVRRVVD